MFRDLCDFLRSEFEPQEIGKALDVPGPLQFTSGCEQPRTSAGQQIAFLFDPQTSFATAPVCDPVAAYSAVSAH